MNFINKVLAWNKGNRSESTGALTQAGFGAQDYENNLDPSSSENLHVSEDYVVS